MGHPVEHYQLLYNPERVSALHSSYYHLYSVVCVLLEPMSFPKFLIVAQSVLKLLNKLLKSKARMSPKNEIIISILCISYIYTLHSKLTANYSPNFFYLLFRKLTGRIDGPTPRA